MEQIAVTAVALPIAAGGLWATCAAQDLRLRRVSLLVLVAIAVVALLGQGWPWWVLTSAALLWPWRARAWILAPIAVVVGLATDNPAAAVALGAGATAWSLGWWGGADAVVLTAFALRHGSAGLIAGSVAAFCAALALMLARRQSLSVVFAAVPGFVTRRPVDNTVPPAREMPAAAAMAFGALIMEGVVLCQTFG